MDKNLVRNNLAFNELWMPLEWLAPYVRIVNWHNTGAAFGIFQGMNGIFMVLAFVIIVLILVYFPMIPEDDIYFRLAFKLADGWCNGKPDRPTLPGLCDRFYICGKISGV